MKKLIKNLVLSILVIAFCWTVIGKLRSIESKVNTQVVAKGFLPGNLISHFPHNPEWDVQVQPQVLTFVRVILDQPYKWLGKGCQAYAFESQDGSYVLKFIQQHRFHEISFKTHPIDYLFNYEIHRQMEDKQRHKREVFGSAKFAFDMMPEECGYIYLHLNRTEGIFHAVKISDIKGETFRIRPDETSFILQRKARYMHPVFCELMNQGDIKGAQARVDQIFALLLTVAQKDIIDGDAALVRNNNIGFSKDRAIYIDTGRMYKQKIVDLHKHMEYEFHTRLKPLYDWMVVTYPELARYFDQRREEVLGVVKK